MSGRVLVGHCIDVLRGLPAESVQCCVTSPPYWGLRSYSTDPQVWGGEDGCEHEWADGPTKRQDTPAAYAGRFGDGNGEGRVVKESERITINAVRGAFCLRCGAWRGELGLEPTPELYVAHLVDVMREVRRVLRDDGVLWLNLGDSYASGAGGRGDRDSAIGRADGTSGKPSQKHDGQRIKREMPDGLKPKDLVGIPWRVAFALQADGAADTSAMYAIQRAMNEIADAYEDEPIPSRVVAALDRLWNEYAQAKGQSWWLRSDVIWHKPNPMPESVTDRPTKSHEYVFLLSKNARYFYDAEAIKEPSTTGDPRRPYTSNGAKELDGRDEWHSGERRDGGDFSTRNARSVWSITTRPYRGAHFATMPPALAERCILAGSSAKGACAKCGKPWERVMEIVGETNRQKAERIGGFSAKNPGGQGINCKGGHGDGSNRVATTIDWQPTCACDAGEPVPCVVLDPFGGAGTTALAATENRRDFMIIELNEEYAEMARERVAEVQPRLGVLA